jgi:hypothetical protein
MTAGSLQNACWRFSNCESADGFPQRPGGWENIFKVTVLLTFNRLLSKLASFKRKSSCIIVPSSRAYGLDNLTKIYLRLQVRVGLLFLHVHVALSLGTTKLIQKIGQEGRNSLK